MCVCVCAQNSPTTIVCNDLHGDWPHTSETLMCREGFRVDANDGKGTRLLFVRKNDGSERQSRTQNDCKSVRFGGLEGSTAQNAERTERF